MANPLNSNSNELDLTVSGHVLASSQPYPFRHRLSLSGQSLRPGSSGVPLPVGGLFRHLSIFLLKIFSLSKKPGKMFLEKFSSLYVFQIFFSAVFSPSTSGRVCWSVNLCFATCLAVVIPPESTPRSGRYLCDGLNDTVDVSPK